MVSRPFVQFGTTVALASQSVQSARTAQVSSNETVFQPWAARPVETASSAVFFMLAAVVALQDSERRIIRGVLA